MDSRLAYVMATTRAESFRRDAEHYTPRRQTPRRHSQRRAPRISLVLMFLRAGR
jgi:hypothetical protein